MIERSLSDCVESRLDRSPYSFVIASSCRKAVTGSYDITPLIVRQRDPSQCCLYGQSTLLHVGLVVNKTVAINVEVETRDSHDFNGPAGLKPHNHACDPDSLACVLWQSFSWPGGYESVKTAIGYPHDPVSWIYDDKPVGQTHVHTLPCEV